jgi:hypothetical protein
MNSEYSAKIASTLNNKYVNGVLLMLLLVLMPYFLPINLIPVWVIKSLQEYRIVGFLLLYLLAYTLVKDFYVALLAAMVVYVLSYVSSKMEKFENIDYVNLLINQYNAKLNKTMTDSEKSLKSGFVRPHEANSSESSKKPHLTKISNISNDQIKDLQTGKDNRARDNYTKELSELDHSQFQFNDDNLRYLNYDKLKDPKNFEHNMNLVEPNLE